MAQPGVENGLDCYLLRMVEAGASDLFLHADDVPTLRVNGQLIESDLPPPGDAAMQSFLEVLLTPIARQRFETSPDVDVAYTIAGRGRFRINVFMQQGKLAIVARLIPVGAVEFDKLNLPRQVLDMASSRKGLVLVVGPTGCGKSTTLAALIHHINAHRREHIVTIEDPIEFVHEPIGCLIHQRQVGYDTESFATALRHVVRQSPDVILIGEMRDRDTMETALNAALTGHLVLSTMHTISVVQSIDRILNYFPGEMRGQIQADLATTLVGMVAMRLLPRKDGRGRIPAAEVLLGTSTMRRLITDGKFSDLYDAMKRGKERGMVTLNQSLVDLVGRGLVDVDDAMPHSPNPDEFKLNMQGMYTGVESIDMRTRIKKKEPELR
jgi:twitching motility protein PilT